VTAKRLNTFKLGFLFGSERVSILFADGDSDKGTYCHTFNLLLGCVWWQLHFAIYIPVKL
jgi:hypothetical protein